MALKKSSRVLRAALFHWELSTLLCSDERDLAALRDLVEVQAGSERDHALSLVDQVIDAPIPGERFADRYVHFWAWQAAGKPAHFKPAPPRLVRRIRETIADNVAVVA